MSFNYKEFLYDNGIVGTTIGTLLGFATKKVFDTFRETTLKPFLETALDVAFDTLNLPDIEMISVLIEYCVILVIVYIISRFIIYPIMQTQIVREEKHKENREKYTKDIVDAVEDIKEIL